MAIVNLGVTAQGATAAGAMAGAGSAMNRVLERVKSIGIPDKDLQTSDISLYPRYEQTGSKVVGYEARTTVVVTVRDIGKAVWVLDGAVEAGANQTYGIGFGLQNPESLQHRALQDALRAAHARADVIAGSPAPVPMPVGVRDAAPAAGGSEAVPVEKGQLTVHDRVNVVYDIAQ